MSLKLPLFRPNMKGKIVLPKLYKEYMDKMPKPDLSGCGVSITRVWLDEADNINFTPISEKDVFK